MNVVLRLFVFILGLSLVLGLTVDSCADGPSSWCKNFHTAKHCGQYQFCKEVVWAQPVQDDEICTLCKDAVQGLGQYMSQNGTKQKVEAALMQLCKDVPIAEISQECTQLISEDFDMLYDEVVALVENGDLVCGLLGLCKTSSSEKMIIDHLIKKMPAMIKEAMDKKELPVAAPVLIMDQNNGDCSDCEKFVKDIQNAIKNNDDIVDEWKKMVKSECDALGPGLSEICYAQTQQAIDAIIHSSLSTDDALSICKSIKMCGFSAVKSNGDACTDCKNFFTDFENMVKQNNSVVDELNHEILDACQKAGQFASVNEFVKGMANFYCLQKPEFLRAQCQKYVAMVIRISINRMLLNCQTVAKKALPELWQLIAHSTPDEICQAIDFCDSSLEVKTKQLVATGVKLFTSGDPCKDCTTFMTDLQGVAKNNQSIINDITDLVKEQCDQLGPGLSELCKAQVGTAVPNLIAQFEVADVGTICTTILMCSSPPTEPPKGGDLCNDCIAFAEDWQVIIKNNKSIIDELNSMIESECSLLGSEFEKLDNLLDKAAENYCKQLPEFFQSKCDKVAIAQINQVLTALETHDALSICSAVHMCGAAEDPAPLEEVITSSVKKGEVVDDGEACELCKIVITEADRLLEENATEAEVMAALEKVCGLLSADIRDECKAFVEMYGPEVVDFLIDELSPNDICAKIKLCKSGSMVAVQASLPCQICELVAQELDNILEDKSIEQDIIAAVERVCSILPALYKSECDLLIEQYGDAIIQLLVQLVAPKQLCTSLRLCAPALINLEANDPCKDCTTFMTDLQGVAKNNQSIVNDLTDLVKEQCDQLGPGLSEVCKAQVSTAVPNLIAQFEVADVGTICTTILMCSSPPTEPPKGGDLCNDCVAFTEDWQNIIKNNQSIIDNFLDNAAKAYCKQLPEFLQNECDSIAVKQINRLLAAVEANCSTLVKDYLPQLWDLVSGNDAQVICSTLYMCDSLHQPKTPAKLQTKEKDSIPCDACEAVAKALDSLLEKNSTEAEIIEELDTVCTVVPTQFGDICKDLIAEYADDIVKLLVNAVSPQQLCAELGLCTANMTKALTPVSNPISCALCRIVVHELDKLIEGNRTEAAIIHALDEVCSVVPVKIGKDCRDFINKYGKDIVEMLINEVESGVICSNLFLCSARPPIKKSQSPIPCELCQTVANALDDLLKENSTEAEIIAAVDKVCSILPSQFKSECDELIKQYGQEIIQLLLNDVTPQKLCSLLGLCGSLSVKSTIPCELCQTVANALDDLLEKNSTEAEIIAAVEKVCSILPSQYKDECNELIQQYGEVIVALLLNELTPQKLCSALGLCSSVSVKSAETCDLCVVVATELDNLLSEHSTEAEIIAAVEKVCAILPSQYKNECDMLIQDFGPAIINALLNKVSPNKLCSSIGLCSSAKSLKMIQKFTPSHESCLICEVILADLEILLTDGKDEATIVNALEKLCTRLPGEIGTFCKDFLDQNAYQLIQFLVELGAPQLVCYKLKVCNYLEEKAPMELCPLCQIVASELDQMLTTNSTLAEFEAALDKVCTLLPGSLSAQCDDFINSVGPAALKILAQEAKPSTLCPALHLCPKAATKALALRDGELCDVCKLVIGLLDQQLESNATREEVEKELKTVCDQAPGILRQTCDDLVKQYTSEILELADHIFEPNYVCLHLGLCKNSAKKPLIGTHPCTYGPSYWCRDEKTAAECRASEHCRLHVWN